VNYQQFFPQNVKDSLRNKAPGAWMPNIPSDCIRLSVGYPAPSLVPTNEIQHALDQIISEEKELPFQYIGSKYIEYLRSQITLRLVNRGISLSTGELLITTGSSQAIDLISRTLLDSSAVVAVEAPTYMEALETFRNYTSNILSIPIDECGLRIDALEDILVNRKENHLPLPKFLYSIPSFHNPSSVTMSLTRRKRLLELAVQFNFLIVEDDAYGELSFSESPTPLKSLDLEGRVLHVGSLSKTIAPGLRIGWIVSASELISAFKYFKKDLNPPFTQALMGSYLYHNNYEERLKYLKLEYKDRRDTMMTALKEYMPEWVKWDIPDGGYFVWLHLPNFDTSTILQEALQEKVSYIPGEYFFLDPSHGREYLRLSFSHEDRDQMISGIKKLGNLFKTLTR
jgi:2-aminoadipate transaminase